MRETIKNDMMDLMLIPGLSGHEDRVRRALKKRLSELDIECTSDRLGNLHTHFPGEGPRVMLFTHMDQLGFVIRKSRQTACFDWSASVVYLNVPWLHRVF